MASEKLNQKRLYLITPPTEETVVTGSSNYDVVDGHLVLTAELEEVCKRAYGAIKKSRTGQSFGKMDLDRSSGMQGIVGVPQQKVEQTFGDVRASNQSRGIQGQIDSKSFAILFR